MHFEVVLYLCLFVCFVSSQQPVTCPEFAAGTTPGVLQWHARYIPGVVEDSSIRAYSVGNIKNQEECSVACLEYRDNVNHEVNVATFEPTDGKYGRESVCYCSETVSIDEIIEDGPMFLSCYLEDNDGHVGTCPFGELWTPWYLNSATKTKEYCGDAVPYAIQGKLAGVDLSYSYGGDTLTITPEGGLVCDPAQQRDGKCAEYEIRVCCDFDGIVGSCPNSALWTPWYNVDSPDGEGDMELRAPDKAGGNCASGVAPYAIQSRIAGTEIPYSFSGEMVSISPKMGLTCNNADQDGKDCSDYEVRFCCDMGIVGECPDGYKWTPWFDRDDADGIGDVETRAFYRPRGTCASKKDPPKGMQARVVGSGIPWTYTGDNLMIKTSVGLVCFNKRQKNKKRCKDYEVRYCCPS